MANDRNAGRKPILSNDTILNIEKRYLAGESLSAIFLPFSLFYNAGKY